MSNLTTTSAGGIHFREGLRNLSRAVAGTFKTEEEGDAGLFATLQSPERHPVEEAPAGEHKSEMDDDVSVETVGGLATFAPASVKSTPIRVNGRPSTRLAAKLRAHAHGQAQGKLQAGHRSWVYRNQIDTPICAGVVGTRKDMFCIQGVDCGMKAHKVKFALAEDTVVIVKDEKKAFQNPSLQWELASRSYLYLNNANSELPNDTWNGMFDYLCGREDLWCHKNCMATKVHVFCRTRYGSFTSSIFADEAALPALNSFFWRHHRAPVLFLQESTSFLVPDGWVLRSHDFDHSTTLHLVWAS